ncbi:hypothetical protein ACLKA7_009197 [Drosophila subpalustris]
MTASQNWKLETKEEVCGQGEGDWQWENRIGGNLGADLRHGSNNSSSSENRSDMCHALAERQPGRHQVGSGRRVTHSLQGREAEMRLIWIDWTPAHELRLKRKCASICLRFG